MRSRELVESLVNFLDIVDGNPDIEECDDDGEGEDAEPSLGSFDRMTDQSKSWLAHTKCTRIPRRRLVGGRFAAIEDFGTLLMILLAQPDAECAIPQMHRVAGLIVCHARAMQGRRDGRSGLLPTEYASGSAR